MKNFFIIVLLSFSGFAFAEAPQCTIENYRDIVFQDNAVPPKCDLRGADLGSFWPWDGADMRGAKLRGADLRSADLRSANLQWADMRWADMRYADLRWANLRSANLQWADMRWADLRGVDLHNSNLRRAKVTPEQAKILQDQGLTGFEIVE